MQVRFFMKTFFLASILLSLFYCSGYFNMNNSDEADGDLSLALADGSGYLSTDNYNEITPFLYRNPDNGKAYLFFASDRDGNYDIYYAEMDDKGKFSKPTKMDANINTTNDETSPVVFKAVSSGASFTTNTYVSLIKLTLGAGKQVYTYQIDSLNFTNISSVDCSNIQAANIGLLDKTNVGPYLLVTTNGTNFSEYYWDEYGHGWTFYSSRDFSSDLPILSVDGFSYDYEHSFIINVMVENKYRLYGGYYCIEPLTNYLYPIKEYSSPYNDKDPCIDLATMKVYFASDRYGKGNYDLYRYNILTFDEVMQLPK